MLRDLYELRGIPAFIFQSRGYSQGDYVSILIVMTPDWAQLVGCPYAMPGKIDLAECERDARGQLAEWSAWLWGDVYGFTAGDESCWGFYGSDPVKSGIAEAICEAVNIELQDMATEFAESLYAARPDLAPKWERV
jgi:hypothetical protein